MYQSVIVIAMVIIVTIKRRKIWLNVLFWKKVCTVSLMTDSLKKLRSNLPEQSSILSQLSLQLHFLVSSLQTPLSLQSWGTEHLKSGILQKTNKHYIYINSWLFICRWPLISTTINTRGNPCFSSACRLTQSLPIAFRIS